MSKTIFIQFFYFSKYYKKNRNINLPDALTTYNLLPKTKLSVKDPNKPLPKFIHPNLKKIHTLL